MMIPRRSLAWSLVMATAWVGLVGCDRKSADPAASSRPLPSTVRVAIDPISGHDEFIRREAEDFTRRTGITVELVHGPSSASERLVQYQGYLGARSTSIDVYQIDVIWPGILADHMIDLGPAMAADIDDFFPAIVENNTVRGRLVAVPWFADAGVLYYREDLLTRHGVAPPTTWAELEQAAALIQEAERPANPGFHGFLWHGRPLEGLTCTVLEWVASEGGGHLLDGDGNLTMNNPAAIAAIDRARRWIGTISPAEIMTLGEVDIVERFRRGDAAFLRSWSVFFGTLEGPGSPIASHVGFTLIPAGEAGHAAALGGWQLAVSRYSPNPDAATEVVRWLTSADFQTRRAMATSILPTRASSYENQILVTRMAEVAFMSDVFATAVARPSTVTGSRYNDVSSLIYTRIGAALAGRTTTAEAIAAISDEMARAAQRRP